MKRFVEGEDRTQITFLPECLDDYVAEDNPVRVIDVFVDEVDLHQRGLFFAKPFRFHGPLRLPESHSIKPPP